jgi:glycosyltransferase involved in cell wall biosynthesis
MSALGIRISIISVYKGLKSDTSIQTHKNCMLYALAAPRCSGMPVAFIPRVWMIRRLLQRLAPDIVHGQGTERENGISALCSGFPNVITIHGMLREVHRVTTPSLLSPEHVGRWVESLVFSRAGSIIAISNYAERRLRSYTRAGLFLIPNAVSPVYFSVKREAIEPTFVFVGSIYPLKGVADLIEAASMLGREHRRARIVIIGSQSSEAYAASVRRAADALANVTVEFLGWQSSTKIASVFSRAMALVHPSRAENAPMAVAEALASGLPVIGTPVGSIPDWIKNGVNGWVVPVNSPSAIAEKMRALLDDPSLTLGMQEGARRTAQQFRPDRIAGATVACYEKVLKNARNDRRTPRDCTQAI